MAIYHLHSKIIQRSRGKNVVASAAYRRAAKLYDEKEQKEQDYTNKPHVIHSELLVPDNSPDWVKKLVELHTDNPSQAVESLWNKVEHTEKRIDAQLAREIEFALPIELDQDQNILLAREFIKDQFVSRGMIADWNVHWDEGNPHVHVMLTMRTLSDEGFGLKVREWNQKMLMQEWRSQWTAYANFHLRLHQHDITIDHRSYQDQGIELVPTIHQGKAVSDMDRRGISTDLINEAHSICRENLARIAANPNILLKKVASQSSIFTHEQLYQELGRYINDKGKFSIKEKGILSESILHELNSVNSSDEADSVLTIDTISKIISSIEQHESVFKERDIAKAVEPYTNNALAFARAFIQVKASNELIHLGVGDDGRDRFTTRSMFQLENDIQKAADTMRDRHHLKISHRRINEILEIHQSNIGKWLTPEQMIAVKHILESSAISCLVGRAGTGKSFLLGMAKTVWEKQGLRVQGIALSGIAADGLNKDAGINSRTIESFRYALSQGHVSLDSHDVVVMDEAGMTDSVSMLVILKVIQAARAKLVLVGDHAQLQPVGPGASFRALIERLGFKEIQTVYRQIKAWQQDATVAFSSGRINEGLVAYESRGCIHLEKTSDIAMSHLVNDWFATRALHEKELSEYLIIAHRNEDVRLLNALLREQRVSRTEIAEGYTVRTRTGEIKIAQDDRILFLKNDRRLGVSNGRFATIKSVDFTESGQVLVFTVLLDGTNQEVCISPNHYSDFTHGYAATVHKVQGMTVDHSFVYAGGSAWNRHLTYVALSRHRHTSHLYADQEVHQDFKTLQRHLGRFGIKDSLLDFPLAFAERRGIDTEGLLKLLPQHLANRLTALKEKVATQVEQFVDPIGFAERCEKKIREQLEVEKMTMRREDAKLVAAYVDVNQKVGMTWQALQTKLYRLGLDKMSYEAQALAIISETQEYIAFQQALCEREAKAYQILKDLSRYELAIDIYSLDVNKLNHQAERHQCSERVAQYLQERSRGAIVHRDRLAAQIMPDIKKHYAYLKNAGMSGQEIKQQSTLHLRRQLFKTLTSQERTAFKVMERYQLLTRRVGERWSTHINTETKPNKRSQLVDLVKLSLERDHLAYQILNDCNHFDKALDFYQIGIAAPYFGDKPTQTHIKQAEARWYKLQQQAARFELQQRVETYHQALFVGDMSTRMRLANEIVQNTKAHHGSIINLEADTVEVWRAIRRDAKLYERHEVYSKLDVEDRSRFRIVESYVEAKQAHAAAWREIFEVKKTANLDEKNQYDRLTPYATRYTQARNELADKMTADIAAYTRGLDYFKLTFEALQPQAYQHQCRMNVENYINAANLLVRAQHALTIIANPKAHHGSIIEQGIQWRDIYRTAKIAERKAIFENLTGDEKAIYRLADRYRQVNQRAGKTFSRFKNKSISKPLSGEQENHIELLFAKRDYLAWRLVNSAYAINPNFLTGFAADHHLNADKILSQHAKQLERLTAAQHWESAYRNTIQAAQAIYPHLNASKELISSQLQKTFSAIEHTLQLQKLYRLNQKAFSYTLRIQGLSRETLDQNIKGIIALKEHLHSLVTVKNLDKNKLMEKPITYINNTLGATRTSYKQIDIKRLREDLNAQASEVTQHYLGNPKTRIGSTWRYGSNQGSLVVNVAGQKQGLWRDFQMGVGGDMLSLIQQAMETSSFKAALEEAARFVGGYSNYQQPLLSTSKSVVVPAIDVDTHILQKIQKAQAIFQATQPISGTLAERYLREHRGITIEFNHKNLRYHPRLKNWMTGDVYPALVIAARDEKDQVCGIQAIFLDQKTAKKAPIGHHTKLSRGLIGEGAVVHQGSPSGKIAFAEGVETALSVASAHPDWKVYTTFGVSNFDKVPLKSKSSDILICADNDGLDSVTAKSVERAANILAHKGINVWLAEPQKPDNQKKWDFNDALIKQGVSQVKNDLNNTILYKKSITEESIAKKISSTLETLSKTTQEAEQGIVPVESLENLSYEVILTQYIEMEIKQTELTHAMHIARLKDPLAGRELVTQALAHSNTIKDFAAKAAEHPAVKMEIGKLKKGFRPASLVQQGGFSAIAERLKQGKIVPEDVKALIMQLRNKALDYARSQTQDRDRGGRRK